MDGNPKLARIRSLLKDLPGEAGNGGQMYAWVDPGDADSMPEHVRGLIAGAMRSCCPGLIPAGAGVSDAARNPPLAEVDEAAATELLSLLLSTGLVYTGQGKYAPGRARDLSPLTPWPSAALASARLITVHDVAFPAECRGGEGAGVVADPLPHAAVSTPITAAANIGGCHLPTMHSLWVINWAAANTRKRVRQPALRETAVVP